MKSTMTHKNPPNNAKRPITPVTGPSVIVAMIMPMSPITGNAAWAKAVAGLPT